MESRCRRGGFSCLAGALGGQGLANEKEIKRLWSKRKEDLDAAKEDRQRIHNILSEIQSDIKQLIAKVGK